MKLKIRLELGQAIDRFFAKTQPEETKGIPQPKHVRKVSGFLFQFWCDYCRMFTDQPENHRHGERPLD